MLGGGGKAGGQGREEGGVARDGMDCSLFNDCARFIVGPRRGY
jgi:hypothetical protein